MIVSERQRHGRADANGTAGHGLVATGRRAVVLIIGGEAGDGGHWCHVRGHPAHQPGIAWRRC